MLGGGVGLGQLSRLPEGDGKAGTGEGIGQGEV